MSPCLSGSIRASHMCFIFPLHGQHIQGVPMYLYCPVSLPMTKISLPSLFKSTGACTMTKSHIGALLRSPFVPWLGWAEWKGRVCLSWLFSQPSCPSPLLLYLQLMTWTKPILIFYWCLFSLSGNRNTSLFLEVSKGHWETVSLLPCPLCMNKPWD